MKALHLRGGIIIVLLSLVGVILTFRRNKTHLQTSETETTYTYTYVAPSDKSRGIPMVFHDPKALQHIQKFQAVKPVRLEDFEGQMPQAVTYVSDNHWSQLCAHLPRMLIAFKSIIIYVLGKDGLQPDIIAATLKSHGNKVKFVTLDLDDYPDHVKNFKNYAFKAIIWTDALQRYGYCAFLDASISIHGDLMRLPTDFIFKKKNTCIRFFAEPSGTTIGTHLHFGLLEYFPVDSSVLTQFNQFNDVRECESGSFVTILTEDCLEHIMRPALMCSLLERCIDYPGASLEDTKTTKRHRYDQSVLNLCVGNLYGFQNYGPLLDFRKTPDDVLPYVNQRQQLKIDVCRYDQGCTKNNIPRHDFLIYECVDAS